MSVIDYPALRTLINNIFTTDVVPGRAVTFNKFDTTPDDAGDPGAGTADPRANPDETAILQAAFVQPDSAQELGMRTDDEDLLKRTSEIAIVQPGPTGTFDLSAATEVLDGGVRRRVTFVEKLQPGPIILLYFVGMAR